MEHGNLMVASAVLVICRANSTLSHVWAVQSLLDFLDTTGLSKVVCWFWCIRSRASIRLSPEHLQVHCETHSFSLSSNSALRRPHSVSTSAQARNQAIPVRKSRAGNCTEWLIQPGFPACAHGFQVLHSHPALVAV